MRLGAGGRARRMAWGPCATLLASCCLLLGLGAAGLRDDGLVARREAWPGSHRWPLDSSLVEKRPPWTSRLAGLPLDLARRVLQHLPHLGQVVIAFGTRSASLWRCREVALSLRFPADDLLTLRWFPAGDRLLTATPDGAVFVWGAVSPFTLLHRLQIEGTAEGPLVEVCASPDGDRIFALGGMGARVLAVATGRVLVRLTARGVRRHRAIKVFPEGRRVVTGVSNDHEDAAIIWSAVDGNELHELRQISDGVRALELSPCGQKLLTIGDRAVYVWDAGSGKIEREIPWTARVPFGIAVARGGAVLAMTSLNTRVVAVFDGTTGTASSRLHTNGALIFAIAMLPGADRLAVFTSAGAAIWDARSGEQVHALQGSEAGGGFLPSCLAASAGLVAACGAELRRRDELRAMVWDAATGQRLHDETEAEVPRVWGGAPACFVSVRPLSPLFMSSRPVAPHA